mmetsp:Transcript_10137/g.32136  ORF Transcript_10137/g.32136 Transcript_10137/m.32136 type:complete len:208 (+) Transcript_10137:320-943(+)
MASYLSTWRTFGLLHPPKFTASLVSQARSCGTAWRSEPRTGTAAVTRPTRTTVRAPPVVADLGPRLPRRLVPDASRASAGRTRRAVTRRGAARLHGQTTRMRLADRHAAVGVAVALRQPRPRPSPARAPVRVQAHPRSRASRACRHPRHPFQQRLPPLGTPSQRRPSRPRSFVASPSQPHQLQQRLVRRALLRLHQRRRPTLRRRCG